ncbi:transcriptional regulator domain-containing protein [Porphyrobacter sp. TH134]|uniref:transcriptional regulator domain-containing protein n=1 Tax=Porphyrobacter sp. TH134 TaxID=2067450 RepID=UPI001F48CB4A|nr:DUF6499 domain-containing protein [Porphyrobacter sp. TH134]
MAISPDYERSFASHDLADFAQEFLRRNPDYRRQYAAIASRHDPVAQGKEMRAMARQWGLDFRHCSCRRRSLLSGFLAPRRRGMCGPRRGQPTPPVAHTGPRRASYRRRTA